jgi:hypothetical protein
MAPIIFESVLMPNPSGGPDIVTPATLPNGTTSVTYNLVLTAIGGQLPYVWSLASGALPTGLGLSAGGIISGTPTVAINNDSFTIRVTDSIGRFITKGFSLTIIQGSPTLQITTTSPLPGATQGAPYSDVLQATGGVTPYMWSIISGSLFPNLSLDAPSGTISGIPLSSGTDSFTAQVQDSVSNTASQAFSLPISAAPTLTITTTSPLPAGTVGTAYSYTMAATGGIQPYSWSITSGTLPSGLTLSSGGNISGTPNTAISNDTVTIRVTDSVSSNASKSFTITINSSGATLIFSYPAVSAWSQSTLQTNGSGSGAQTLPGSKLAIINGTLTHQANACFYSVGQVSIDTFTTDFTFQMPSSSGADGGFSFVVQNSNIATQNQTSPTPTSNTSYGVHVCADANVAGYGGYFFVGTVNQFAILNSIAVTFDWYTGIGNNNAKPRSSVSLNVNGGPNGGICPVLDTNPTGVNFKNGNVVAGKIVYDGTILTLTLVDQTTNDTLQWSWPINIQACVGGTQAWVGFTGGSLNPVECDVLTWDYYHGYNSRLSTPSISPAAGSYTSAQTVTITGPSGAAIYYSTNGLPPSAASTLYTGAFSVSSSTIVQAIAIQSGYTDSYPTAQYDYQIQAGGLPRINFPSGFSSSAGRVIPTSWAKLNGSAYQLTDATSSSDESGAIWYAAPVPITSGFSATFQLQFGSSGQGIVYTLQNQNQNATSGWTYVPASQTNGYLAYGNGQRAVTGGPLAFAYYDDAMGYGAIDFTSGSDTSGIDFGLLSSVGVAFDVLRNQVGVYLNGAKPTGSSTALTGGVNLSSGHPFNISVSYSSTTLTVVITDSTNGTLTDTLTFTVDIPGTVGASTATVGFTASTGGHYGVTYVNSWEQ